MSMSVSGGIRVQVEAFYLPDQSAPVEHRYVFGYRVRISNEGTEAARLDARQWIITDGKGARREVQGPGVVGQQPHLQPGQSFEYVSGCVLETSRGTMRGSYQMGRDDGRTFDAEIAPFELLLPQTLN